MNNQEDLPRFPPLLRALLDAELAAGNNILEMGHAFPAPPVGAWVMLARPVSTRPRQPGDGLTFRTRNWNAYSFEWSDAQGYFFLLEPPLPEPPAPDMDEIRDANAPRAFLRPPESAAPTPLAPGEHAVEVDYRGEMLTYREAARRCDVICTWGSRPIIARRSLSGWWYPAERRSQAMTAAEQAMVFDRMVEHFRRQGTAKVDFED